MSAPAAPSVNTSGCCQRFRVGEAYTATELKQCTDTYCDGVLIKPELSNNRYDTSYTEVNPLYESCMFIISY